MARVTITCKAFMKHKYNKFFSCFWRILLTSQHLSTVVSEEPLQDGEDGMDGAAAITDNHDESGTTTGGQTQGLQDTRYGICIPIKILILNVIILWQLDLIFVLNV